MHTTSLRKVGGSIMLAVPPAFLEQLHLQAGTTVGVAVEEGRLVVEPAPRRRYTMAELLRESAESPLPEVADAEWTNGGTVGGELL